MNIFPEKLYVGLIYNTLNSVVGKVVLYDNPNTKTTQKQISRIKSDSHVVIDNKPQSGWYIIPNKSGVHHGSFIIMHPQGLFEFELSWIDAHALIRECTIKNGIIQDMCLFDKSKKLIKYNGSVQNKQVEKIKSTKSFNEELKSLKIGDKISVRYDDSWKDVIYCGKYHAICFNGYDHPSKSKLQHVLKYNNMYFMVQKINDFKKINVSVPLTKEEVQEEFNNQIKNKHYRLITYNYNEKGSIYFPNVINPLFISTKPYVFDDLVLNSYTLNINDIDVLSENKIYKVKGKTIIHFTYKGNWETNVRSNVKITDKNVVCDKVSFTSDTLPQRHYYGDYSMPLSQVDEVEIFYFQKP